MDPKQDPQQAFDSVTQFYRNHPINEEQILGALKAQGIDLSRVTENDLKAFDQDHYGGIPALESLMREAGINNRHHVLDVCSGMGGPARYLAHAIGCHVTGIDLTESRCAGAARLTSLVKLDHQVDFRHGNALEMPFADASFDVVIAQEAWAHIPDKPRLVAQVARVVKAQGVVAFTDIMRAAPLAPETARRLFEGMTFTEIESVEGYAALLEANGCTIERCTDPGAQWTGILQQRHAMYRSLRASTVAKFGEEGYRKYDDAYAFFVSLYQQGVLGGARFIARKRK